MFPSVVLSSRIVDAGYMTSLMTSSRNNLCRNFGANYLGNDARWLTEWFQISNGHWTAYRKVPIGYRLGMLPMTSRDPMTSQWWRHDFFL